MFECTHCLKTFTRKDSLLRHTKALHSRSDMREFPSNNNNLSVRNQFKNTSDHCLFDPVDKHSPNDVENKTPPVQDDLSEYNYDVDDPGRNNENNIVESKEGLNSFDQRIRAAAEAIKSKFNALRKSRNVVQNYNDQSPVSEKQEDSSMKIIPENNNSVALESKLPELLQCMLDILMIKELQNVDIIDKDEEDGKGAKENIILKRGFNSVDEEGKEFEIKSPEEEEEEEKAPLKRFKYDDSMECENGIDNSSTNSECNVKKYWHNPNTLVNELRNMINGTDIGQQIATIINRLNKNNNNIKTNNYFEYIEYKEERSELLRNLKELKKTTIGHQIFCILNELEKAKIIEPINGVEHLSDDDDDDNDDEEENNITGDTDESITVGNGSRLRPYKGLIRV